MIITERQMVRLSAALVLLLVSAFGTLRGAQQPGGIDRLQRSFEQPPDDARIMMRWWWFGPAVSKPELEREMRAMKAAGIGGFEVQPVYPVTLDEANGALKTTPYLSDGFIDALRFASAKARELGLRIDLTIGSGWPYGGPWVAVDQAAGRLRVERTKALEGMRRVPLPSIGAGERLISVFIARSEGTSISGTSAKEITESVNDGIVTLPANVTGPNEVLFFIASRTGQQVKRPAVGSEGFVVDHYDRGAVDHYLKSVGDRLLEAFGSTPPYAIFCDSLEVYSSDWAPDLLPEFQKRRGYDLKPFLPALIADIGPSTAGIRHDWGQTLTELLNERFLATMRDWSKKHGTLFRIQGYGVPPMTMSGNSFADLPEGEGAQWKIVRAARWASSASHIYGRPVTSSETWTWLHSPSFRATPLDIKAEADLHFLQGVNQLIGHGWPYTPEQADYPGNRFYAAAVFDDKNPWWMVMPDLSRYLQRVSYLMRQGSPANDVALYLPNSDAWSGFTNGRIHMIEALKDLVGPSVMPAILEAGFNLDFFDDDALRNTGRVTSEGLELGANRYRAVVLPNVEHIPVETLRKLDAFATNGGVVIATRRAPDKVPGFMARDAEQREMREISGRLFAGSSAKGHLVADERTQLAPKLASLVQPDVALTPAIPEIGFVHRHTQDADVYFVANTSNAPQKVKARFRVTGRRPESWDSLTGNVTPIDAVADPSGTTIDLNLEAYGSSVIVFARRTLRRTPQSTTSRAAQAIDISRGWRLSFKPADGKSSSARSMDQLRSWTESEETRFFSGVAEYEKDIALPGDTPVDGVETFLDFGDGRPITPTNLRNGMRAWYDPPIRDAAEVFVNGQRAGSLWLPPYRVNVTGMLKRGDNHIRVVVGNTAINHLAGRKLPDYRLLNLRYGERFQPQDMENMQPLPSGMFGPVRIIVR